MDPDEQKFLNMAMKHLKKGALAKKAKEETPVYAPEPVAPKAKKEKKTEVPAPAPAPASEPAPAMKKGKRPPTEWNKLVQKHHAMVKGQPDAFQKAIKMAKEERAGTGHKAPELKKEAEKAPPKKKVQKHLIESEDS
jgi:pyruvate/2-oxoglutarate dehydrogenase complex dihydrolipoamide acyltransferase (E2) component